MKLFFLTLLRRSVSGYPSRSSFPLTHAIEQVAATVGDDGSNNENQQLVSVAGRVKAVRVLSKRMQFVDLASTVGLAFPSHTAQPPTIQVKIKDSEAVVVATSATYAHDDDDDDTAAAAAAAAGADPAGSVLRRGNVVAVSGTLTRDKRKGRPLLLARRVELLTPCTTKAVPPTELADPEIRFRNRHLDLFTDTAEGQAACRAQHVRSRLTRELRRFLVDGHGFSEIETPILGRLAGGAAAQPFVTAPSRAGGAYSGHGALTLRISPELYLKRAVCAGLGRVFEIGKCFRDEGMDATHSPEYTMCELYQAHADCDQLMQLTENLCQTLCRQFSQQQQLPDSSETPLLCFDDFHGNVIDFSGPFRRVDFVDELEARGGPLPGDLSDATALRTWARRNRLDEDAAPSPTTAGQWLDFLFGRLVEPELGPQPTFVCNHPASLCPLAKLHQDPEKRARGLTERFELFVGGVEWCNAYQELNDPVEQRARFMQQADNDVSKLDQQFLAALEFGLPPTAGWGFEDEILGMNPQITVKDDEFDVLAIHVASRRGFAKLLDSLLQGNPSVSIDVPTKAHDTCLHLAASVGHTDVVKLLLARGADPATKNKLNLTAKQIAENAGHLDTVRLLEQAATAATTAAAAAAAPAAASIATSKLQQPKKQKVVGKKLTVKLRK